MKIGIYLRLSKEDELCHEESNSITMQRILLLDYVREHFPDAEIMEFSDDGYSGTNFDRPGVQELLEKVKNGEIGCIIVKDFSRFARDYIELGSYLEQIFPFMGVRFISVNDGYDSDLYNGNPADMDVNFKNLLCDLYSRDLSVKIKSSFQAARESGKFIGAAPPFGYRKDPDDRHRFVIEEDEAAVVRRIFRMYADGMSSVEIAGILNREGVKTPAQVWMEKGIRASKPRNGIFLWRSAGIVYMLENRSYVGDLVQGTTESRGIGERSRWVMDPDRWIIFENHHEGIVDRELFGKVQGRIRSRKRKEAVETSDPSCVDAADSSFSNMVDPSCENVVGSSCSYTADSSYSNTDVNENINAAANANGAVAGAKKKRRRDGYVLVGRVRCGCCGRTLQHYVLGNSRYFYCAGLHVFHLEECVKRIDDVFLEEMIMYQLQQHIMELGETEMNLQAARDHAVSVLDMLRSKCKDAELAIAAAKGRRLAAFEAYALGKTECYDAQDGEMESLRRNYEELTKELAVAKERVREFDRRKVHESIPVMRLTKELLDEYVEWIEVHGEDDVRIKWK